MERDKLILIFIIKESPLVFLFFKESTFVPMTIARNNVACTLSARLERLRPICSTNMYGSIFPFILLISCGNKMQEGGCRSDREGKRGNVV